MARDATSEVRLAELVAALSLATDLGLGQPQEHVLRQTVIATRLATVAGLPDDEQAAVFYVSLLAWVGCIADSHELARSFGDDRRLRAESYQVDKAGLPMLRFLLGQVAADGTPLRRITMVGRALLDGFSDAADSYVAHCQTTGDIADRLGLHPDVCRALPQAFARWDGKGVPGGLKGEQIQRVMRVVQIADDAEVFCRLGGIRAALEMLSARSGTEFDPAMVDLCRANAEEIFGDLETVDAWSVVIDGSAALDRRVAEPELDTVLETFADYADLKSPWFLGHSRAVAALAAQAATRAGLSPDEVTLLARAALVARLGGIGVSTSTWDKRGPLSAIEWERVRTVPYLTERVLSRQPWLADLGAVAGMCHERMDGSGYPRGLAGAAIPITGRLLAAAEVYQALGEARPYRPALARAERERMLLDESAAGRLDAGAVRAVLAAAGHQARRRPTLIAGLTAREAEVLTVLVRGWSNRQIAGHLSISKRTVATKSSTSTRRSASPPAVPPLCSRCVTGWSTRTPPTRKSRKDRLIDRCDARRPCRRNVGMSSTPRPCALVDDLRDGVGWPVAGLFLDAITRRDFRALAACLDPQIRFRALVPSGQFELTGPADTVARFQRWYGDDTGFEVADASIGQIGSRIYLRWRVHLGSAADPGGGQVVEQHAYATGRDQIEALDLLCSGFHLECAS